MYKLMLILLLSIIVYYLSLVVTTKLEFKRSKVDISFLSALLIPFYILNEVRKMSNLRKQKPFKFLTSIPLYNLYLIIYSEVIYFSLKSNTIVGLKHKLKAKSLFSTEVKTKFLLVLEDYINDTEQS